MHSCLVTYLAQLLGIFLCLAFQFEYARTNGNTWIFNKKPKFILIFCSLLIISYGVLCYPIFMCKLNFSPQKHIDKNSSLYLYLSHETSCFSLGRLETPQISTLIVASLIFELSFLLCFIFIHYKLIKLIYINNTLFSTRTYRLQQMLYKSILAQTLCFATIYMFPVGILLVMLIFKFQFSSSLALILMSIINCYELMNYIVMLYYISSFKKTLKNFLSMFFNLGNMQNVAMVDCNPGIVNVNDVIE
jgi:hypothetical protein